MLDPLPGQFRNVNHTIDAAQVYKCTIAGQGLYFALVSCTNFCSFPELFLCSFLFSLLYGTNGANCSSSVFVDFENYKPNLGLYQCIQFSPSRQAALRCRNEYPYASVSNDDAALYNALYSAFQYGIIFLCSYDFFEALLFVNLLLRQGCSTILVIGLDDNQIQFVTNVDNISRLQGRIIGQFRKRNIACILCASVYNCFRVVYRSHSTLDFFPFMYFLEGLIQCLRKIDVLFIVTFHDFAHCRFYLLNDVCRRGRTGGNADFLRIT